MTNKIENYSMSFNQILVLMFTLITSLIFEIPTIHTEYHWIKVFILLSLYIFLALISNNWLELIESLSYISLISLDEDMGLFEKLSLIKSQLDMYTTLFDHIFTEVRNDNINTIQGNIIEQIKTLFYRAINGKLNIIAGIWIFLYATYLIFIQTNEWNLAFPVNTIVTMGAFMGLSFTSGHMKGIGEFVNDIIKEVKKNDGKDEKLAKQSLDRIRDVIRTICLGYNRISKAVEQNTGKPIMELLYGIKLCESTA